jgi:hypothetical protein
MKTARIHFLVCGFAAIALAAILVTPAHATPPDPGACSVPDVGCQQLTSTECDAVAGTFTPSPATCDCIVESEG